MKYPLGRPQRVSNYSKGKSYSTNNNFKVKQVLSNCTILICKNCNKFTSKKFHGSKNSRKNRLMERKRRKHLLSQCGTMKGWYK